MNDIKNRARLFFVENENHQKMIFAEIDGEVFVLAREAHRVLGYNIYSARRIVENFEYINCNMSEYLVTLKSIGSKRRSLIGHRGLMAAVRANFIRQTQTYSVKLDMLKDFAKLAEDHVRTSNCQQKEQKYDISKTTVRGTVNTEQSKQAFPTFNYLKQDVLKHLDEIYSMGTILRDLSLRLNALTVQTDRQNDRIDQLENEIQVIKQNTSEKANDDVANAARLFVESIKSAGFAK